MQPHVYSRNISHLEGLKDSVAGEEIRHMLKWSQRNWLITGASGGFGLALAREVLTRGGRVIATSRSGAGLEALLPGDAAARALVLPLNVANLSSIDATVTKAEAFGGIDVLVNNAGYGFLGGVEESSDTEVRAQFDINFFGPAAMMRAVLPSMRARGAGTIVNISSVAGAVGGPGGGYYSASKWALEGLSESLAREASHLGVRVLIVEPGLFRTSFFGGSMVTPAQATGHYPLVESTLAYAAAHDGSQAGDPARAASIIVDTLDGETLPQRLLLGCEANALVEEALQARLAEAVSQRGLALAACFPPALADP